METGCFPNERHFHLGITPFNSTSRILTKNIFVNNNHNIFNYIKYKVKKINIIKKHID